VVEQGPVADVLGRPLHPYTARLLDSVPKLGMGKAELTAIPGQVPDMGALPPGCAFHPRCERASEQCHRRDPVARSFGGGRLAACFHVKDAPELGDDRVA
jgi:oligopeptide/dipeptide ABC transporter ATP-binding protein